MHGSDSAFLGTGTTAGQPLPVGARAAGMEWRLRRKRLHLFDPSCPGGPLRRHSHVASKPCHSSPHDLGNIDAATVGYRWYPFMNSRAGLAWHQEYSWVLSRRHVSAHRSRRGGQQHFHGVRLCVLTRKRQTWEMRRPRFLNCSSGIRHDICPDAVRRAEPKKVISGI